MNFWGLLSSLTEQAEEQRLHNVTNTLRFEYATVEAINVNGDERCEPKMETI